ncbi:tetratricopeptide repeat protein [Actinokineospora bangkokensis]|uniref:Uncharacterized protein n=1 Tax=Actinokineospora bangkokensis TaxID=1193682 RepID=A0A1Q9LGV7_9PSEU|nr:tetratricopeptide repeat protein [Actinokineospora bangkokensis]OLR91244.1 hypothetical protein BJP25_26590 [Actinokineospora bangkokensis]
MLRTWEDVIAKWRAAPAAPPGAPSAADRGRSALLSGHLDEARAQFEAALAERGHPHDHVGLGDVALARGQVRSAVRSYRAALGQAPGDRLALLGLSQAHVANGEALAAAEELERLHGGDPDPVLRYYLASTWCSVADQARAAAPGERAEAGATGAFTTAEQVATCERAARRILDLDVDDEELRRTAERLLAEVDTARRYRWQPEGIAVSLAVLAASLGLTLVAIGGVSGSVALVVAGIVTGSALLYLIVVRFRRPGWRGPRRGPWVAGTGHPGHR